MDDAAQNKENEGMKRNNIIFFLAGGVDQYIYQPVQNGR